jgi:hypothetical protein
MDSGFTVPPFYGIETGEVAGLQPHPSILISGNFHLESFRLFNRMKILGANGPVLLTIPVKKSKKGTPVSDIRIDYIQKWQNQHWRSLQSAYGKSPYFQYFRQELEEIFYSSPEFLLEFTGPVLQWILKQYYPNKKISVILAQNQPPFQPDDPLLLSWLEYTKRSGSTIRYTQVFGLDFVPGLSVLDHLFCEGTKFWNLQN